MRLPRFEYIKASTVEEAINALGKNKDNGAKILAGGTDLLVSMKQRIFRPAVIIGIKSVPHLNSVSSANGTIKIGTSAIISDIINNNHIKEKLPLLHAASRCVASKHIRNTATIGGNVCLDTRCWYYNQSKLWRDSRELCYKTGGNVCHAITGSDRCHAINNSDTAPALIALDASITVKSKNGERTISVKDFYRENGKDHLNIESDELVASLAVPQEQEGNHSVFIKISRRKGIDFAAGSIAASVTANGNKITGAKLVTGSLTSSPVVLKNASSIIMESGLTEKSISEASKAAPSELGILTNLFTQSGYKRQLAESLTSKALNELKEKIKSKRKNKV